jgi:hypothetical protein
MGEVPNVYDRLVEAARCFLAKPDAVSEHQMHEALTAVDRNRREREP